MNMLDSPPELEDVEASAEELWELYRYLEIDAKLAEAGGPLREETMPRYLRRPKPNSRMVTIWYGDWKLAVCHRYRPEGSEVWKGPDPKRINIEPVSFFMHRGGGS